MFFFIFKKYSRSVVLFKRHRIIKVIPFLWIIFKHQNSQSSSALYVLWIFKNHRINQNSSTYIYLNRIKREYFFKYNRKVLFFIYKTTWWIKLFVQFSTGVRPTPPSWWHNSWHPPVCCRCIECWPVRKLFASFQSKFVSNVSQSLVPGLWMEACSAATSMAPFGPSILKKNIEFERWSMLLPSIVFL